MGKEGWFHGLGCVARPEHNENTNKLTRKAKKLFRRRKNQEINSSDEAEAAVVNPAPLSPKPETELIDPDIEEVENEDAWNADSDENGGEEAEVVSEAEGVEATAEAEAEADAVEATSEAEADGEVVRLSTTSLPPVKSKEEIAALKIQSVFRGFKERRSFRSGKGLLRLKTLVRRQPVKRQATTTLNCMQAMARVQHQVRARRLRMSEENHALYRQQHQKHDLEKLKENIGEEWNHSKKSLEEVEAKRHQQLQAAIKRERTLAYAYTRQQTWRNSPRQETQTSMDPFNLQWDWNWVGKWMAARPWENKNIEDSEPPSAKSVTTLAKKARRDLNLESSPSFKKQTRSLGRLSMSTNGTTSPVLPRSASTSRVRVQNSYRRRSVSNVDDDDAKSVKSERVGRHRRQNSCPIDPIFKTPTSSSKEKSHSSMEKGGIPEDPACSAKKKLSFTESPSAQRRHSDPQRSKKYIKQIFSW